MKFEKNGIIYTVTDTSQIDAFKNSDGWQLVEEVEVEVEEVKKVRKPKVTK